MKKIVFAAAMCLALSGFSQENDTWRIGAQFGIQGTRAHYSGGMPDANARFHQNKFDASALNINARYDLNKHWMGTIGLGLNTFGFQYSLSQNYSLYNPKNHFSGIQSEFSAFDLPIMIFYKFNSNCKNAKWLIGGGFSQNLVAAETVTQSFQTTNDGVTASDYLNSVSSTKGGFYTMLRFAIAREKVFKKGSILNASLVFNAGLRQLATSTVNYMVDGQAYTHDFTTKGNFAGLRLTYFFRPLKTKSTSSPVKAVRS